MSRVIDTNGFLCGPAHYYTVCTQEGHSITAWKGAAPAIEDVQPDCYYSMSRIPHVILSRGRILSEALRNDPMAPRPLRSRGRGSGTLYLGQDILDYVATYERTPEQAELEKAYADKLADLSEEIGKKRERILIERIYTIVSQAFSPPADFNFEAFAKTSSGIYLLYNGRQIVYIGQSNAVFTRIGSHIRDPEKDFDGVRVIPCPPDCLDELEALLIRIFSPKCNKSTGACISGLIQMGEEELREIVKSIAASPA